jgi:hypothetical protein
VEALFLWTQLPKDGVSCYNQYMGKLTC